MKQVSETQAQTDRLYDTGHSLLPPSLLSVCLSADSHLWTPPRARLDVQDEPVLR